MKNFILSSVCTIVILVTMQSCQKDVQLTEKVNTKEIAIDTTISSGSSYALNLASFGDEGDVATIIKQAAHSSISRIENETDMFTSFYHYIPSEKITGKDEVTLSIKHYPHGSEVASSDSTLIYINFTIK